MQNHSTSFMQEGNPTCHLATCISNKIVVKTLQKETIHGILWQHDISGHAMDRAWTRSIPTDTHTRCMVPHSPVWYWARVLACPSKGLCSLQMMPIVNSRCCQSTGMDKTVITSLLDSGYTWVIGLYMLKTTVWISVKIECCKHRKWSELRF